MPSMTAIIEALNNDSAITAELDTFDFGAGAAPAIFANAKPIEAAMRSISVTMITGYDVGSNAADGIWVLHDIRVEDDKTRSDRTVRDLAWMIRDLFHKKNLNINADGYTKATAFANVPMKITSDDGFPGYVIQVKVLLVKDE